MDMSSFTGPEIVPKICGELLSIWRLYIIKNY